MSRRILAAPFAIATDGTILINVAMFDVPRVIDAVMAVAQREHGALFVGLALTTTEIAAARETLRHALREAAAVVVGSREARRRR